MKLYNTLFILTAMAAVLAPTLTLGQTLSGKGVNTGSDAISAAAPQVRGLGLSVNSINDFTTQISGCAANGEFFDNASNSCVGLAPVDIQFSQNASSTTLRIQRPDGSYETYQLDGANGSANVVPFN